MEREKREKNKRIGLFGRRKSKNQGTPQGAESLSWNDFQDMVRSSMEYDSKNLSGVYQCIELISNTISKLPYFVINDKTKKPVENSEIYRLLNLQPNPKMTASVFWENVSTNILTDGNAYFLPKWKGLKLQRLDIVKNSAVGIVETVDGNPLYIITDGNGNQKTYRYDEIVHLRINAVDGIKGISPLTYARLTTEIGLKQEVFQKDFYDNGGRPDGVLKTATDLSTNGFVKDEKGNVIKDKNGNPLSLKDVMREEWKKAHSGLNNRFNVAILDNGLEYQTIPQISPADMDFVNSKTTNIEDICRYFNVPPYKLGVGKQTYSSNEQADIEYIKNTIVPLVNQFEQELTLKLLLDSDISKQYKIKCNVEDEMRGDTNTRVAWYQKMQSIGAYSINEIRAKENLPDIEYGDARLIGANSVPLERLVKGDNAADTTPNPFEQQDNDEQKEQDNE